MGRPDDGMFSIKLVSEGVLYPHFAYFHDHDYDSGEDRSSLMNFSPEGIGPSVAANIPIGNRALVYIAGHQKFVWAIEYTGTVEDGKRIALLLGVYNPKEKWRTIFRPIRHLARVDLATAPTLAEIKDRTGVHFTPNSFTSTYISADDYQRIYDAIPWQWTIGEGPRTSGSPQPSPLLPPPLPLRTARVATSTGRTDIPPKPPEFELPPIPGAESLLARIRQVQGMPERNMEDVVKAFLILLGHPESAISFQVGHVDVRVNDEQGKSRIVVEVKRSLLVEKAWRDARRKGFDYAGEVGAPLVVMTDADIYEVYDRRRGHDYDSMRCGRLQLTRFAAADRVVLDMLRPATGANP